MVSLWTRATISEKPIPPSLSYLTIWVVWTHERESRLREPAHALVRALAEGEQVWAIPWPCCYGFLGVVTNHRFSERSVSPQETTP